MGVFALFGFETVHYLGEPLVGFTGLLSGIGFSVFFATLFTGFAATFGYAGLVLFFKYRKLEFECELENDHE